ncbi:MAG TPA: hypothetical protein VK427_03145, partial [Kofleriaceae bacterium]|nr:hypothetical protein [Kofleriaceae bacterium]
MKSIALVLTLAACTETRDPLAGTQSLEIELVTPTSPGDVDHRLLDSERKVVINIRAKDAEGQLDASFNDTVRVYAQFLGTLTPDLEELPIASIAVVNGAATNQTVNLPASVLGPTTLWIDNGKGVGSEYQFGAITGTSVTLWYRDPFIRDLQTPRDEMAVDALSLTPLTDKQVRVGGSRHGATGALVITSTFAQGYTVSDVNCTTGGPMPAGPCTAGSYDHVLVFTFSAPRDQYGRPIVVGEVIASFSGGLTEFNGLTEIGFPRTYTASPDRET